MPSNAKRETAARDSVLARLMLGFQGSHVSSELAAYLSQGLAGVALYSRNFRSPEDLRKLTDSIYRASSHPVLIGIDQEGGTRFALPAPFTSWPSAAELGRLGDEDLIRSAARAMALELRAAGCNLDFAPMLDLNVNPESPVTRDRSFGNDPHHVARMGVAFHQGLRQGGVLSCAKHFPGHGDAMVDPHLDLPVFHGTMEQWESTELVPFSALVASGAPMLMTAHIVLPQIDAERPASLSKKLLDGILRRRMKFNGVILADDLGMGAIAKRYGAGDAAVQTLCAGTDIVMLCHDWKSVAPAITVIRNALDDGRLGKSESIESFERIERICLTANRAESQPSLEVIGCAEHRALASEIRARLS